MLYYKLTIIVKHIDFFLSFCILKMMLKNERTLCISTTSVELFVLFFYYYIFHGASFHIITILYSNFLVP